MRTFLSRLVVMISLCSCAAPMVGVENADTQKVKTLVTDPSVTILDVRSSWEYQAGHLAHSKLIPINELESRINELSDKNKPVLVYCAAGGRSAQASKLLVKNGFTKVINYKDGFRAWESAGNPVER